MPVDFDESRWDRIKETYRLWWAGALDRLIVPVELENRDPGRDKPDALLLSQSTCTDLSISPDDLVDRLDYELATRSGIAVLGRSTRFFQPLNGGYVDWGGMYSDQPFSMLRCDFCYMIGPGMFDEFVKPELEASSRRLSRSFYHLDGPGKLPHLDSLLTMDCIDGVQWGYAAITGPEREIRDRLRKYGIE